MRLTHVYSCRYPPSGHGLFTGTVKLASAQLMLDFILASGSELVTLAMRQADLRGGDDALLPALLQAGVRLLPNTSGAKTADEALFAARLAHEALGTYWIKLESHPDMQYLLPDPIETLKAAEQLVKEGSIVLPYAAQIRCFAVGWRRLVTPL